MELKHVVHSGHPTMASSEVNVNTLTALIEEYHLITCCEIAAIIKCSGTTIENIMKRKL